MYAIAHEALQEGTTQVVLVAAGTVSRHDNLTVVCIRFIGGLNLELPRVLVNVQHAVDARRIVRRTTACHQKE
jgi:hypothetical protein